MGSCFVSQMWKYLALVWMLCLTAACSNTAVPAESAPEINPLVRQGEIIFKQNCATCHAITPDTIIAGPSMAGIAKRAETRVPHQSAEQYIEMAILDPGAYVVEGFIDMMPNNFDQRLSSDQLSALLAYLMTLE